MKSNLKVISCLTLLFAVLIFCVYSFDISLSWQSNKPTHALKKEKENMRESVGEDGEIYITERKTHWSFRQWDVSDKCSN